MACGTTYQTTADEWSSGLYIATSNQVNALDTVNNWLSISDVYLYLDEGVNPEPIKRHIQQELALCERYYEKSYNVNTAPGTASTEGAVFTL